jgi:hypothetical protein
MGYSATSRNGVCGQRRALSGYPTYQVLTQGANPF